MSKKTKSNTVVVALKGTKYIYYTKLNVKLRKTAGKGKLRLRKYNPVTRQREIFGE
jgi:ribosomal protein L33